MQLRTFLAASILGAALACVAGLASAQQIYKWKDASGVTHFSQTPPANGTHYTKMRLTSEPDVSSNPPAASNGEAADQGDNHPAPQAAAAGQTQADTPSNRTELCKQLSSNISLLQGKQPVVTGGSGKQAVMSDSAREQQLATARAQQTQYCSGSGKG